MKDAQDRAAARTLTAPGGITAAESPLAVGIALALVTGLGLFLRLYQIGAEGLTPDEGISIQRVRDFHWDYVRPLYYLLLWAWMPLGGSVGMLRLPSALMGAATVLLVFLLGQRLFGARAALIAALLVAVSPLHLNHSQEIRMYSQVTLFSVASFFCFWRLLEEGRTRNALAYGAATLAALLTQPVAIFVLAAQNLYLLVWWRRHRRLATWWLLAQGGVVLVALPFIHHMVAQAPAFAQDWASTREKPALAEIVRLVSDLSFWRRSLFFDEMGRPAFLVYYTLLVGVLALLAAAPLLMRKREPQVTLALAWFAVPLLGVLAISYSVVTIWEARYLIYVLPAYALLIGFSVDRLAGSTFGRPAAVLLVAVVLAGLGIDRRYFSQPIRPDWRGVVEYIRAHRQPGDGFGVYADQAAPAFGYYFARELGDSGRGQSDSIVARQDRGGEAPAEPSELRGSAGASPPRTGVTFESPRDGGAARNAQGARKTSADEAAAPGKALTGTGGSDWAALVLEPRVFRELTPDELRTLFACLPADRPRYWLILTHHEHRGGGSIKRYVEARYEVLDRPTFDHIEMLLFRPVKNKGGDSTDAVPSQDAGERS